MDILDYDGCKGPWPPPIKTMKKGTRTKRAIIATAAPVFNTSGYAGTSIADILEATGLEKGGLYRHFTSKDELAIAAFDFAVKALERRHSLAQSGRNTATDRLLSSVNVVASFAYKPPLRGGCPILNTGIDSNGTHTALFVRAASALRNWQSRLARVVEDGVASGELRPGIDSAAIATILTSSLEGALLVATLREDSAQMECVAEHLRELVRSLQRRRVRSFPAIGRSSQNTAKAIAARPITPVVATRAKMRSGTASTKSPITSVRAENNSNVEMTGAAVTPSITARQ